ncbi:hypothetical protein CHLRE_13g566100v5 [Chlamydomonas reinhardtii]|uniref:Uncharacterized protein n=1 Tax=Chlamydomonas reinhardtii TaxID=3055 RepID=A0A2K3CZD6_CHLRE|nr:uncharacterized protein CHLRE_13g566100v5 [Chlamydomonas reinhardtii]PNW73621.1 hypothetical protein CHLRE_13g566100v5 [Chlamydomonas reinhardtii]
MVEAWPTWERDVKLGVGAAATLASRYYFNKRQLWPWRISTLIAWPALGLGLMDVAMQMTATKEPIIRKVDEARAQQQQQSQQAKAAASS